MNNLHWWAGPQSDLTSAPAHCWGHIRLVCAFSSPLLGAGFTVGWHGPSGLLAHCQACGSGDLAYYLGWIGKVHRGRRGRLSSLFLQRSASGGVLCHREGVRPAAGGVTPQKHSVGCLSGASKFPGRKKLVPFGILAGGWAREMALACACVPHQAELCLQGLNNSPSRCPPALPFSEQSC